MRRGRKKIISLLSVLILIVSLVLDSGIFVSAGEDNSQDLTAITSQDETSGETDTTSDDEEESEDNSGDDAAINDTVDTDDSLDTNTDDVLQEIPTVGEIDAFADMPMVMATYSDGYASNVFPVDEIVVYTGTTCTLSSEANTILVDNGFTSLGTVFGDATSFSDWYVARVEKRSDGCYSVIQYGVADGSTSTQKNADDSSADAFLFLMRKSYVSQYGKTTSIAANWPEQYNGDHTTVSSGYSTNINKASLLTYTATQAYTRTPYGYITFFPKNSSATAAASTSDKTVVGGNEGIKFELFNYSTDINKNADCNFRSLASYFTFRGDEGVAGTDVPTSNINATYDADGFTANHATVEAKLDDNGNPVLKLNETNPELSTADRNLGFLFGDEIVSGADSLAADAVTVYSPTNTILQKNGTHYTYNSMQNAVDYDTSANLFRVRAYKERNSTTAGQDKGQYYDFLPFNYTNGNVVGTTTDGYEYNVESTDTDYWFGMTMEVQFVQPKDGILENDDMTFKFSGDDDVWVFIDDVLVLDLGGTHGTVNGSINFKTGEIKQYLSWNGGTEDNETTSFPTTLQARFEAAGKGNQIANDTFADYTQHTLKFFYLERGSAVANCMLDFNLPTLPDNSLTVGKTLESAGTGDALKDFLEDTLTYKFRVLKVTDGTVTNDPFVTEGMPYTILETGRTGTVGDDGYFELKPGQSAQFDNMLVKGKGTTDYVVEEILPDTLTGQYAGVEYTVGTATNSSEGEDSEKTEFTSYRTGVLSAETINYVNYKNKVDTAKLSLLKVTKEVAQGSKFDSDKPFDIQVKLGNELLPEGTKYKITGTDEIRIVTTEGIIPLKAGETATILTGIISGTTYEVTEPNEDGTYRIKYSGTVTQYDDTTDEPKVKDIVVAENATGVTGEFPLNSEVSVVVENADYDVPFKITLTKQYLGNVGEKTFAFEITQVKEDGTLAALPGTSITVTDDQETTGKIVIGYSSQDNGTYIYQIKEVIGSDQESELLYDDTVYTVTVAVTNGNGVIKGVTKDGVEYSTDSALKFVNRKNVQVKVQKNVTGNLGDLNKDFQFTLTVKDENENVYTGSMPYAKSVADTQTMIQSGDTFTLKDDEYVTIEIPYGFTYTVTEDNYTGSGYVTSYSVNEGESQKNRTYTSALTESTQILYINYKEGVPDMGVDLNSNTHTLLWILSTVMILAVGVVTLSIRRRKKYFQR